MVSAEDFSLIPFWCNQRVAHFNLCFKPKYGYSCVAEVGGRVRRTQEMRYSAIKVPGIGAIVKEMQREVMLRMLVRDHGVTIWQDNY